MKKILVTGGAGFLGSLLLEQLLNQGYHCVSVDIAQHNVTHTNLITLQIDISDKIQLETIFQQYEIEAIFHCAALLAHGRIKKSQLWTSNVTATQYLAELAEQYKVPRLIFTSTNCLWGENLHRSVTESDTPAPVELYGQSKLAAEKILLSYQNKFKIIIFRCPTIIDAGRLGLLSILFEFINEGRKIYLVGGGKNHYQFIYAQDLISALIKSLNYDKSDIFNIGSDNVQSLHDVFNYVIRQADTGARTTSLPKAPAIAAMKLAYHLRISPLGPYHYKMIAEDFVFDTTKVKLSLKWQPTLTNEEMLWKSYEHYMKNQANIKADATLSAHKQPAKMGIIRLLKWLS